MNRVAAMLCAALFFSCTDVQRDNPDDSGGINYHPPSSSFEVVPLSSSAKPSSSSFRSSSAAPSSSSAKPSSSSAAPSSSSAVRSSSSSKPTNNNEIEECDGYCLWEDGCVRIETDPAGVRDPNSIYVIFPIYSCEEAIDNCILYSPTGKVYSNSTCNNSGGSLSSSSIAKSSSSSVENDIKGPCSKDGKYLYCNWPTDKLCYSIDSQYGSVANANPDNGITACTTGNCTCENLIKNCDNFGYMYNTSDCSGIPIGKNDVVARGCCRWNPSAEPNVCWTVYSDTDWGNCDDRVLTGTACPNNGTCPK